jgi:hypothetical protein
MKLSIATLNVANSSGEIITRSYFFVSLANTKTGHTLHNIHHIGRNEAPSYHDWDRLPSTLRQLIDIHSDIATAIDTYITIDTSADRFREISVREVTGDELTWFMTYGYGSHTGRLFVNLLDNHYFNNKRSIGYRIHKARLERYEKLVGDHRIKAKVEYKGMQIHASSSFASHKATCKMMGEAIRQAIKDDDASDFESSFMDMYIHGNSLHERIFDRANELFNDKGISTNLSKGYCDHVEYADEMTEVYVRGSHREYCQACRENEDVLVYAEDTEEYILREDAFYDDNNDEWLSVEPDSDDPDDNDEDTDSLMSYRTNVLDHLEKDNSFFSSPFGDFHMGVELELITRDSVNDAVEDIRSELGDTYCICKTDGSLPSGGLEIVSAPRGLAEHIEKFKGWNIASYYYAWNGGKCGMHVHMDSKAFTKLTLGKFIMFINSEHNTDFIRKLAGRHAHRDEQARSYCAVEGQEAMANASKALKGKSTSRYYMVNTTCLRRLEADRLGVQFVGERDFNTIELRIFRATLKKERLLAQIEFTHAAVMFCRVASMRDLNEQGFLLWLKSTDNRYPHLADWYGIRRRVGAKNAAPTEVTCSDNITNA